MVRPSKRKVNTNIHNNVGKFPPHPLPGSFSHFSSGGELHDKENKGCVKNPGKRVVSLVSSCYCFCFYL